MNQSAILKTNVEHLGEVVARELHTAGIPVIIEQVPAQEPVLYSPNGNEYRGEQSIIRYSLSMNGLK